jgi:hypothetical protein
VPNNAAEGSQKNPCHPCHPCSKKIHVIPRKNPRHPTAESLPEIAKGKMFDAQCLKAALYYAQTL